MNIAGWLYLTSIIEGLDAVIATSIVTYIISCLFTGFIWMITNDGYSERAHETANNVLNWLKGKLKLFIAILIISVLIPGKTTMYMMLGSYYLNNSTIPSKVSQVLDLKLDDIIKKLKEEKSNDK